MTRLLWHAAFWALGAAQGFALCVALEPHRPDVTQMIVWLTRPVPSTGELLAQK